MVPLVRRVDRARLDVLQVDDPIADGKRARIAGGVRRLATLARRPRARNPARSLAILAPGPHLDLEPGKAGRGAEIADGDQELCVSIIH